jgi:hypothetical protein
MKRIAWLAVPAGMIIGVAAGTQLLQTAADPAPPSGARVETGVLGGPQVDVVARKIVTSSEAMTINQPWTHRAESFVPAKPKRHRHHWRRRREKVAAPPVVVPDDEPPPPTDLEPAENIPDDPPDESNGG